MTNPSSNPYALPNITLREPQALILALTQHFRFTTAVCHRRMGKTILAAYWLATETINSKDPTFRAFYFAPTQKQAKLIVWHYFKQLFSDPPELNKAISFSETELQITLPQGQKIILAGSENIEFYRGWRLTG